MFTSSSTNDAKHCQPSTSSKQSTTTTTTTTPSDSIDGQNAVVTPLASQ